MQQPSLHLLNPEASRSLLGRVITVRVPPTHTVGPREGGSWPPPLPCTSRLHGGDTQYSQNDQDLGHVPLVRAGCRRTLRPQAGPQPRRHDGQTCIQSASPSDRSLRLGPHPLAHSPGPRICFIPELPKMLLIGKGCSSQKRKFHIYVPDDSLCILIS